MTAKANIQQYIDNLYLITLPVAIAGFDAFIGSWVWCGNPMIMIDVGPSATVPKLLSALAELDSGPPEIILLTHIHIDHAGGIGSVAAAFPDAVVVCHPKGAQHLIAPDMLWQGSLKTLGHVAEVYGAIPPLSAGQVVTSDDFSLDGVACIKTPGHAVHHMSYCIQELLFAGEAGGVCLPLGDGAFFLRPATPPRFFLETSISSIDRILAGSPSQICYGHVGMQQDGEKMLRSHRDQLQHWLMMIEPFFDGVQGRLENDVLKTCCDYLLDNDPFLAEFKHLPPSVQAREHGFMINALKGFWGYIQDTRNFSNRL
jgi:glyoxylase-like metal-dependent hydrolase (beta-lactamase superfamily II)